MRTLAIAAAIAATTAVAAAIAASSPANATSGPGCLRVVNVAPWDVLHLRKRPNPNSRSVAQLDPNDWGILHLDAPCSPKWKPWGERWCPVTNYNGDRIRRGWIKARFVRDSDCP